MVDAHDLVKQTVTQFCCTNLTELLDDLIFDELDDEGNGYDDDDDDDDDDDELDDASYSWTGWLILRRP